MAERHVAALLREAFRRGGMVRSIRRAEAVVAWPRVVGPELARFARARALKAGVLFVDVPDSETAMHLSLQRARILEAYARRLGRREVRDVRFVAGRPTPPEPDASPPPPRDPDPEAWSDLSRRLGALDLPESLAGPALRAGRALLAHHARAAEAGWRPCPHCGAPSPGEGPCDPCVRARRSPAVLRASETLSVRPKAETPTLSEEERAVARDLAIEALDARIQEATPQVLADPRLRPQLAAAVRVRFALADDVPASTVTVERVARTHPAVARVLTGTLPSDADEER